MKKISIYMIVASWIFVTAAAFGMYSVPETREVPIGRLIHNLESHLDDLDNKNSYWTRKERLHQLARLSAMAYTLNLDVGHETLPKYGYPEGRVYFHKIYKGSGGFGSLGREVPDPVKGKSEEYLDKAIYYYRKCLKEPAKVNEWRAIDDDWRVKMGLGWALSLKGEKQEAAKFLREALSGLKIGSIPENSNASYLSFQKLFNGRLDRSKPDNFPPDKEKVKAERDIVLPNGVRALELWKDSKKIQSIDIQDSALKSIYDALYGGLERNLKDKAKYLSALAKWKKNKSSKGFVRLMSSVENSGQGYGYRSYRGSAENLNTRDFYPGLEGYGYYFGYLKDESSAYPECSRLSGSARFAEFNLLNRDVCLIQLARKKKNWGICRSAFARGVKLSKAFQICIDYLALAEKSEEFCGEVNSYLQEIYRGFSKDECKRVVKSGWKPQSYEDRLDPAYPSFFQSLEAYEIKQSGAFARIMLTLNRHGGATLDHFIFLSPTERISEDTRENAEFSPQSGLYATVPYQLKFKGKGNKDLGQVVINGYFFPTESDLKSLADQYDVKQSLGVIASAEIATYLIPLLDPKKDQEEIKEIKRKVMRERISWEVEETMRPITPLAIPIGSGLDSCSAIDKTKFVSFDLDGSGIQRKWQWIRPNYAWLVYLNKTSAKVRSALQMFGNVTFWLFWRDGFEALCSLDDNGDGTIRGDELRNLYLWNDKNSNGIQDAGELSSLEKNGITGLRCDRPTRSKEGLKIPGGVEYGSKKVGPIYDVWLSPK